MWRSSRTCPKVHDDTAVYFNVRGKYGLYLAFGLGFLTALVVFELLSMIRNDSHFFLSPSSTNDCTHSNLKQTNEDFIVKVEDSIPLQPKSQKQDFSSNSNQFRLFSSNAHSSNVGKSFEKNANSYFGSNVISNHRQLHLQPSSNDLDAFTSDLEENNNVGARKIQNNNNNVVKSFGRSAANRVENSNPKVFHSIDNDIDNSRHYTNNIGNINTTESNPFDIDLIDHKLFTNGFFLPQTFTQFAQWYFDYETTQIPKYDSIDREIIAKAYANARFWLKEPRRSGKLYMEHHIGTASCMMNISNPRYAKYITSNIIAAAMLHSSYVFGDVPMQWWPIQSMDQLCKMRQYVAQKVGVFIFFFVACCIYFFVFLTQ